LLFLLGRVHIADALFSRSHSPSGLVYPLGVIVCRRALFWAVRSSTQSDSFDFAGVIVLLIVAVISVPQFYILAMMDEPSQFAASVLAFSATETAGAIVTARAAHIGVDPLANGLRALNGEDLKRSSLSSASAANAQEPNQVAHREARRGHEHADRLLATKIVHEELGEMIAVFVGCGAAAWVSRWRRATIVSACFILLVEVVSDVVKDRVYVASGIPTGNVRYRFNGATMLAVVSIGAAMCCIIVAGLRVECWAAAF
jgi:hypothetical protein